MNILSRICDIRLRYDVTYTSSSAAAADLVEEHEGTLGPHGLQGLPSFPLHVAGAETLYASPVQTQGTHLALTGAQHRKEVRVLVVVGALG